AVATRHGKERAIAPPFLEGLPLAQVVVVPDLDTDRFGTFSGEVERRLSPPEAALAKARAGAEASGADLVIASEGSFGPYPPAPFVPCDEEFLVLLDLQDGRHFLHRHLTLDVVFGGERCDRLDQVLAFAERMRYPEHALILRERELWSQDQEQHKGLTDPTRLRELAEELLGRHGSLWACTDQRAMLNPTRMEAIATAAEGFVQELSTCCPACGEVHFAVVEQLSGLPCGWCGTPTDMLRASLRGCAVCGHRSEVPRADGQVKADPGQCPSCNP
ncbi:MAG: hypothetical protein KDB96_17310, partial [Flavobacteriales bacterium]|nr:hypothetical protein [Flavobacteriales bacterium]